MDLHGLKWAASTRFPDSAKLEGEKELYIMMRPPPQENSNAGRASTASGIGAQMRGRRAELIFLKRMFF